MITRQPIGRQDLRIGKKDRVLEIGSGHNPTYRSNVLTDKFPDDNTHRCGNLRIFPHQTFIKAEGERLPFADNEFDYVICNQVIEHAEDPIRFGAEITRVGRRGYIETPSLLGEMLFPKESHKWVILPVDGKLIFYEKTKMPGNYGNNYGEVFLNYLPYQSLPFKLLMNSESNLMITSIEWQDNLEIIVNPTDDYYASFFTKAWTREMTRRIFPERKILSEISHTLAIATYIIRDKVSSKLCRRPASMTLEEYMEGKK